MARKHARRGGPPRRTRLSHWRADMTPKTRFASEDDANRAAFQARLDHGRELTCYQCEFCGGWHLAGVPE